jgi:hypothetical protein
VRGGGGVGEWAGGDSSREVRGVGGGGEGGGGGAGKGVRGW